MQNLTSMKKGIVFFGLIALSLSAMAKDPADFYMSFDKQLEQRVAEKMNKSLQQAAAKQFLIVDYTRNIVAKSEAPQKEKETKSRKSAKSANLALI